MNTESKTETEYCNLWREGGGHAAEGTGGIRGCTTGGGAGTAGLGSAHADIPMWALYLTAWFSSIQDSEMLIQASSEMMAQESSAAKDFSDLVDDDDRTADS